MPAPPLLPCSLSTPHLVPVNQHPIKSLLTLYDCTQGSAPASLHPPRSPPPSSLSLLLPFKGSSPFSLSTPHLIPVNQHTIEAPLSAVGLHTGQRISPLQKGLQLLGQVAPFMGHASEGVCTQVGLVPALGLDVWGSVGGRGVEQVWVVGA